MEGSRQRRWSSGLLVLLLVPGVIRAQYEERSSYEPSVARYVTAGADMRLFEPLGNNPVSDSLGVRFRRVMPMIAFHQGLVDVVLGYAPYTLRGQSRSSVFFGTTVANEFPVTGRRTHTLLIPILLAADYTKAESVGEQRDDFNIGSIGFGGGLKYRYVTPGVELSLHALEVFHFSFEGRGVGTGVSAATLAEGTLLLRDILVADGLVIGYRFRMQTWSMSDRIFRYRTVSHGPYIGVLF